MAWQDFNRLDDMGNPTTVMPPAPQPQDAGRAGGLKGFALDLLPFARVAEKTINPNAGKVTGGELLSEAALTLLPFGLGRVAKGARAVKAAVGATRGADATATATKVAAPSVRQRAATELTARGGGFKVGGQVGGTRRMEEAADVYQRYGVTGTPKKQLKIIDQTVMPKIGKQVDDILEINPVPLSGKNVRAKVQQAVDDPLKYAELDLSLPGVKKALSTHLTKFESAKSAKEVNDYIKTLNPIAIRAQDKLARGVNLTDKEAAALAAKKAGDEVLSEIKEIAPLKKDMATLFDRYAETSAQVGKKSGLPIIGGVLSAPASAARYVESKAGQLLSRKGATAPTDKATGGFRPFLKPAAQQAGVRFGAQALDMRDQGVIPESSTGAPEPGFTTPFVGQDVPQEEPQTGFQSLFSDPQKLEMAYTEAIMRGDKETANLLLAGRKQFASEEKKVGEQEKKIQAGKTIVDNLMQVYDTAAGGAQGVYKGTAADVLGRFDIGESNQKARAYEQNRMSYLTPIIKAFGEVGVLTDKDREVIAEAIPSVKDSPAKAEQKRQLLYTMLESLGGGGSDENDLNSALEQLVQEQVGAYAPR